MTRRSSAPADTVLRVQWRYPHWTSASGNSRLYLSRAAALRLARKLESGGAAVTLTAAPVGPFVPVDLEVST